MCFQFGFLSFRENPYIREYLRIPASELKADPETRDVAFFTSESIVRTYILERGSFTWKRYAKVAIPG
jgi:hypothetical protein